MTITAEPTDSDPAVEETTKRPNNRVVSANASPAAVALAVLGSLVAMVIAFATDGELEPIALMVGAAIAALMCFDRSLDRTMKVFWPWQILSVAILSKAVPSVVYELAPDGTLPFARYDQVGTVIAGGCAGLAMTLLAFPQGKRRTVLTAGIVGATALAFGAAGATVAFVMDPGYVTLNEARGFETAGWVTVGWITAALAVTITIHDRISRSLTALIVASAAIAIVAALASSGHDVDIGWWLAIWAWLTVASGVLGDTPLGERPQRNRASQGLLVIAVAAAVLAAGAIVWSEIAGSRAEQGWLALALLAGALLVLAGLSLDARSAHFVAEVVIASGGSAAPAEAFEAAAVDGAFEAFLSARVNADTGAEPEVEVEVEVEPSFADADIRVADQTDHAVHTAAAQADSLSAAGADLARDQAKGQTIEVVPKSNTVEPGAADPVMAVFARPGAVSSSVSGDMHQVEPDGEAPPDVTAETATESSSRRAAPPIDEPGPHLPATVRTVGLEPHHFDPSTGLVSASGLQEVLRRAFRPAHREPGELSILMIALRNSNALESEHGRIAASTINKALAQRLVAELPHAVCAHYSRSAFAAVADHRSAPPGEILEMFTRTLLALLEDVELESSSAQIDVVGGMAQCYSDEDVTSLVARANEGLEQAVRSVEPTLVSMP